MHLKRSSFFVLRFDEEPQLDLGAMLRGQLAVVRDEPLVATSLVTGAGTKISDEDLRVLRACGATEWRPRAEVEAELESDPSVIDRLLDSALLLGDGEEAEIAAAREREERLAALEWDEAALLYHVMSRVRGMDAAAGLVPVPAASDIGFTGTSPAAEEETRPEATRSGPVPFAGAASVLSHPAPEKPPPAASSPRASEPAPSFELQGSLEPRTPPDAPPDVAPHLAVASALGQQMQATIAHFGPPPGPFHEPAGIQSTHELPKPVHQGPLLETLLRRRTHRLYDPDSVLSLDELSTLLYFTYGAHGAAELTPGVVGLRKTSPSGGAMHPVEVYPLILQVDRVPPGLYHYSVEKHALSLLRPMSLENARGLATTFTCGQTYYATAHALFLLTARFFRTFWKYRKSQKAYKVIHLDAGHLSQTLYLLATALGLGAFFTGAVNDHEIEECLGLDRLQEGVLGISGCGRPRPDGDLLALETQPFTPRGSSR